MPLRRLGLIPHASAGNVAIGIGAVAGMYLAVTTQVPPTT